MLSLDWIRLGPRTIVSRRHVRSLAYRLEDGRYRLVTLSHGRIVKDEMIDAARYEELAGETAIELTGEEAKQSRRHFGINEKPRSGLSMAEDEEPFQAPASHRASSGGK